ncbi:MAG: hypothetical protein AABW71_00660 [Nanoarchaeota archaeon]
MSVKRVKSQYVASEVNIEGRGAFVKIVRDGDDTRAHLIPRSTYDGLVSVIDETRRIARDSLGNFPGYLHANDREDMRAYLQTGDLQLIGEAKYEEKKGDIRALRRDFERSIARAAYLRNRGVPPVFSEEFESPSQWTDNEGNAYHRFPTVDTIINIVTREKRPDRPDGRWGYSNPARIENIEKFSQYLSRVDEGALQEQLVQEIDRIYHFSDASIREYVIGRTRMALDNLRANLMPLGKAEKVKKYNSSSGRFKKAMEEPFWFTHFDKDSVQAIMGDYWQHFVARGLDSDVPFVAQAQEVEKVARLFPQFVPTDLPGLEVQRVANRRTRRNLEAKAMDKSSNFGRLTRQFYDACDEETVGILTEAIGKRVYGKNEHGRFRTRDQLRDALKMPDNEGDKELHERLFGEAATQVAKRMDLKEFCELAGNAHQHLAGARHVWPYIEQRISSQTFGREFKDYWSARIDDSTFILPPSKIRDAMSIGKFVFNGFAEGLVEEIGLAYVGQLTDQRVVEVVNKRPALEKRPKTELALAQRIKSLVDGRGLSGKPIKSIMAQLGIKSLPKTFERFISGQTLRPDHNAGRYGYRHW